MTRTPLAPAPAPALPAGAPLRTYQRIVRAVAIAACLPYLALKVAWISGSVVGIPEGSDLRHPDTSLVVANIVSVTLDATLVLLVLLLTMDWGLRVRSWLLTVPVFVATGLLGPIVLGFPVQVVTRALGGGGGAEHRAARTPFLADWVFTVVYTGFIVQAAALAVLFVPYAIRRWGHLWRGGAAAPMTAPYRITAAGGALAALVAAATNLYWACGGTRGLNAGRIAELDSDAYSLNAVYVVLAVAAATGLLALAFRPSHRRTALALAWTGCAAMGCWGGWIALASLSPGHDPVDRQTGFMYLIYACEMIVGALGAVVLTRFLTARRAA
ncbi:hypothetical protein [Streptomyces sp. NPDC050738]|uniref:hypothetical protein n=1 Tax=Streptomyces sp. NPDC050738 TaxID=3154744 RepID=UPI003447672C